MRYLCLICAETVMEQMPDEVAAQHYLDYEAFTADVRRSGHFVAANRLTPSSTAATVRVRNGDVNVTDGPFAETKEQIGGYYVIEARDMNEAVRVASKIPGARVGSVELRPIAADEQTIALGLERPQQKITPFLWFENGAEDAARFYTSLFPNSRITRVLRYDDSSAKASGRPPGSVLTVAFELAGQAFTALNGGPQYRINEAVSFVVDCETQQEIDMYWDALAEEGQVQQCGWLRDRYGVTWQIVPAALPGMLADPDRAGNVMAALLQMKKLDLAALEKACGKA